MGRSGFLFLGVSLLVVTAPLASAGACFADIEVRVGAGSTRFAVEHALDDTEAADVRTMVDGDVGNGDGDADGSEVDRWEAEMSQDGEVTATACLDSAADLQEGMGVFQEGPIVRFRDPQAALDLQGETAAGAPQPLVIRLTGSVFYAMEADATDVVVMPEGFEGLSEAWACLGDDRLASGLAQDPCGDRPDDPVGSMRLVIRPAEGFRIDGDSIRPPAARSAFDGTAIVFEALVVDDTLVPAVAFRVVADDGPWALWAAVTVALTGLGALVVSQVERARFRFWWFASVLGFTRIKREKALDNERRGSILAAIESEPGVHLGALQRGLDLATGSLVHHLRVLEQAGLIETRRRANRVGFVPAGHTGPLATTRSRLQERLLATLRSFPGLSQSELAARLGEPRNTVAYNVRRLMADGEVEVRREGRELRHFVADEAPTAP